MYDINFRNQRYLTPLTPEIKDDYDVTGNDVFNRFYAKKDKTLWCYGSVAENLLNQWPESPLSEDLKIILEKIETMKNN